MIERKYGHHNIPHAVVLTNNTNKNTKISTSIGEAIGYEMISSRERNQSNNTRKKNK